MESLSEKSISLLDGSRIITEACVQSGADIFIGYPITPTNWIYRYSSERFPHFLSAPDEISTLQWMSGFSSVGKFPVTATSFPGLALMTESINMAFMMELPLLIILSQRLGPSTGSATTGAQGDLLFLRGIISGGYPVPVFCISNFNDCWFLTNKAIHTALYLRTPVILLTSKEMIMTQRSFDLSQLKPIPAIEWKYYNQNESYMSYDIQKGLVPDFLPLGNNKHQVRLNASTHDPLGIIKKATPIAIGNTMRLYDKISRGIDSHVEFELDDKKNSDLLIVSYGITSEALRDAVAHLRMEGKSLSYLILKTILPMNPKIFDIFKRFKKVVIAEENHSGLLTEILYGHNIPKNVFRVNKIGSMITPSEIAEVCRTC